MKHAPPRIGVLRIPGLLTHEKPPAKMRIVMACGDLRRGDNVPGTKIPCVAINIFLFKVDMGHSHFRFF